MSSESFLVRFLELMKKSKKAVKLYSSLEKAEAKTSLSSKREGYFRQVLEWREANRLLLEMLQSAHLSFQGRALVDKAYAIRDDFFSLYRETETEFHLKVDLLNQLVNKLQFVKAKNLSHELIQFKAKVEAYAAVCSELQDLLDHGKVARGVEVVSPEVNIEVEKIALDVRPENVIPLKRKKVL